MLRSLLALFVALVANQAVETFRVSTSSLADVQQATLHAINPESKQTTEIFPGTYVSPYGEAVMKRIAALLERVDQADREALVAKKVGVGFDRSITSWRAHPAGRTVALAVHYYRDRLLHLEMEMSDDYGRTEPFIPARYEFFTIAGALVRVPTSGRAARNNLRTSRAGIIRHCRRIGPDASPPPKNSSRWC